MHVPKEYSETKVIKNPQDFKSLKDYLTKTKRDYGLFQSGTVEEIIYRDVRYLFVDVLECSGRGFHISSMVQRDIDSWIESNEGALHPYPADYKEQMFNVHAIEAYCGQPAVSIDINDCYWRTAYKLGYITEATYMKGKRKKEWKTGRNASIGSLAKSYYYTPFVNGKPDRKKKVRLPGNPQHAYIRNHVIGYVCDMFLQLHREIGNKFLMFLTDCVFTDYEKLEYVRKYFAKNGYKIKSKPIEFTSVDREKKIIRWLDFDARNDPHGKNEGRKYYFYNKAQMIDNMIYPISK